MKIVHYRNPFLPKIGGAEIYVNYLSRYLATKGHEVTVLTQTRGYFDAPYNTMRLSKSYKILAWLLKNPVDVINFHNFSIRYSMFGETIYPIYTLNRLKKVPIVFTLHTSLPLTTEEWKKSLIEMKKSDFVIFINYSMLKYAKKNSTLKTLITYLILLIHPCSTHEKEMEIWLRN